LQGRGEGTAKRLYTVAFEKEIVIELQTGNQRDQEKDRGARIEGIAGKAMHGSFRNGGEGDMVSAGRGPGPFSLLIVSDYKGCRWGNLNFKLELGSWNQGQI
jgi:hypothetical protein